ncbi:MAG: DUF4199 domain-containing protein [Flavobacterium sp.]|nr:DUF4199 domain-containing protein [Flavobacterium sp.]
MEKNISPAKSALLYGVLFGIIMIFEFVIMYVIGMKSLVNSNIGLIVNIANYLVLPILFIFLGCQNYKNKINNGFISLGESLKVGISTTFMAAFIYATFNVLFNILFPDFIDEMIAISKEAMISKTPNLTPEQLEEGIIMMKKFMNPFIVFPVTLAMYSFFGLIYSLIIGSIVKNEKS